MPLHFVREYIVTIPVKDPARAPRVALRDLQGKLRIKRVETVEGDHLRVTATVRAAVDDDDCEPDSDRFDAILKRVELLLPGAGDMSRASLATETHAVSKSRLPVIGKTRLHNLFLNTALGTPSWINALGAGQVHSAHRQRSAPGSPVRIQGLVAPRAMAPYNRGTAGERAAQAAPPKAQTPINAQVGSQDEPVLHQLS